MSWLRTSLNITLPDPGSYYATMNPLEFYEWRYTGTAPRGSVFIKCLPSSDIFMDGKIVASAVISDDVLEKASEGYRLTQDTPIDISLKIGQLITPKELIQKHKDVCSTYRRGIQYFTEDILMREYIKSGETKSPVFYRVSKTDDGMANLTSFGRVSYVLEKIKETREILHEESLNKKGRSIELADFRRFENAMVFSDNHEIYIDASKIELLLSFSGIKPKNSNTMSFEDLYIKTTKEAAQTKDRINQFLALKWVRGLGGLGEGIC